MDWNEIPQDPRQLVVLSGASKMILELPLSPRHLGVPSGVSQTISKPLVCLLQIKHLSCTDTNTISKWTKTRFHKTHITLEFHRVHPKQFLRWWYVRHKPCTYLSSRLALSLDRLNRASNWASSPRSTIGCVQNNLWACGTFFANGASTCVKFSTISKWSESIIHLSILT
jgi:hypothetical protein